MTRAEVRQLQINLNDLGYGPLTVDGIYGPKTDAAFRKQSQENITPEVIYPPVAKPWWTSRAVLGLLASVLAMIAGRFGFEVNDGQITDLLLKAVELGGLALAAWGTVRRSAPIDPTLVARVGTRDLRLPVRSHRAADSDPRGVFRDS